ncbi:MAG: hypothetical protein AAF705_20610, partial [Bacteroidota bacterium]
MDKQYSQIAKVKLTHEFYQNEPVNLLQFQPSPLTNLLLNQLDIRLRISSGEMTFYIGHATGDGGFSEKLSIVPKKISLVFQLLGNSVEDAILFNQLTKLPFERIKDKAYWYSNSDRAVNGLAKVGVASAEDEVFFVGPYHKLSVPTGRPQYAFVYNSSGMLQFQERIGTSDIREFLFDLSEYDWGNYHLGFLPSPPEKEFDTGLITHSTVKYIPSDIADRSIGFISLQLSSENLDVSSEFNLNFGA